MIYIIRIIGVYTGLVLIVARLVRAVFIGKMYNTIYLEIPQVDYVFQLCMDLYLVHMFLFCIL